MRRRIQPQSEGHAMLRPYVPSTHRPRSGAEGASSWPDRTRQSASLQTLFTILATLLFAPSCSKDNPVAPGFNRASDPPVAPEFIRAKRSSNAERSVTSDLGYEQLRAQLDDLRRIVIEGKQGADQEQNKKIQELDDKVEPLRIEQQSHDTIHRLGGYGLTPNPSVAAQPKPVERKPLPPDAPSWLRKEGTDSLPSEPPETTNFRAKLLNPIDCPEAKEGPGLPALFEVPVSELFHGGEKHVSYTRCLTLGRCWGDASSKRVRIRTEFVACSDPKGRTGYAHGEGRVWGLDGQVGVTGKYDRKGKESSVVLALLTAGLSPFTTPCMPPSTDVPPPPEPEQPSAPLPDPKQQTDANACVCAMSSVALGSRSLPAILQEATDHYGKEKRRLSVVEVKAGAEGFIEMEVPAFSLLFGFRLDRDRSVTAPPPGWPGSVPYE